MKIRSANFRRSPERPPAATLRLLLVALALVGPSFACAPERNPNILLITLDTMRPDHLGPYGYDNAHTPNLDRFAETADVYERAYATSSWTLASHASIFTGLLPGQHGAQSVPKGPNRSLGYGVRPLAGSFLTLAEILSQAGYRTGAVVAGPALRAELGTAQGFEFYEDELDSLAKRYNGKRANETTNLALGILAEFGDAPWFLFVNYFDAHAPYAPPATFDSPIRVDVARSEAGKSGAVDLPALYLKKLLAGDPAHSRDLAPPEELAAIRGNLAGYDAEIAYLDQHLGRLLDAALHSPHGDDTWVILTSDHGESFGEHYYVSHGAHLYEDNVRVPLIVRAAGATAGRRIVEPVQNHRLFGSILEIAGLERPEWALPLVAEGEANEIVLEVRRSDSNIRIGGEFFDRDVFSLLRPPFKLIRSSRGELELFDLSRDPQELENLLADRPDLAAELDDRLSTLQKQRPPLYREHQDVELREDTAEALRAMGYIE